jgi:hypothetical protein
VKRDRYNEITEVKIYEGSSVLWGANSNTPTLSVMKSLTGEGEEMTIADRYEMLYKRIKRGSLTSDEMSLLAIEVKQLEALHLHNATQATEPADEAVQPEADVKVKVDGATLALSLLTIKSLL